MLSSSLRSAFGRTTAAAASKKTLLFPSAVVSMTQQIRRSVFIQTAETPNPESLKFVPSGVQVLKEDSVNNGFYITKTGDRNDILRSPLAKTIFDVDGVKAVYLGPDFVTVTKYAEHKWKFMRPELFEKIMEWSDSGIPALTDEPIITDTTILDDDTEIVAMIKELIESRIRPAVQEDGGDIRYVNFEEDCGRVTVELAGSCVGCPSSAVTLKQGVENMLMHYIPEVKTVVATEEEEENDENDSDSNNNNNNENDEEDGDDGSQQQQEGGSSTNNKQQKTYEERLAAAGIPFSD